MATSQPLVLIIDNDDALVEALEIRLSNEGYGCVTANSGMQGVSLFNEGDFTAVITDMNMPGGDGISVCENIRKVSQIPLIVITGFEASYIDQLEHLENIYLLNKPFDIETLLDDLDIAIEMQFTDLHAESID